MAVVRRVLASVLAWTAGAVAAVGVGLLALSLIGDGLSTRAGQPLTPDAIAREASAAPVPPAGSDGPGSDGPGSDGAPSPGQPWVVVPPQVAPSQAAPPGGGEPPGGGAPPKAQVGPPASATPPRGDRPAERLFSTSGGTAIARCTASRAYLVSWSPRQGYRYDNVERGPGDRVRVRFRSDDHKVDLRVTCPRGVPEARIDDDRD